MRSDKNLILFVFLLTLITKYGAAQQTSYGLITPANFGQDLNLPSLGGGVQVNQFTGIANVVVPFFQFSISGLDLGVSMSYNTKGLQVDRIASNLGLGWELNAGGYLERVVRGAPDDINMNRQDPAGNIIGSSPVGYWFAHEVADEMPDDEPDYYVVNIGGKSFSMMFSKDGDLLTIPDNIKVKVARYINGSLVGPGAIPHPTRNYGDTRFVITDEYGNEFDFRNYSLDTIWGSYTTSAGATVILPTGTYKPPTSSWQLNKVGTFEGKVIKYSYEITKIVGLTTNNQQFVEKNNNYGVAISDTNSHYTEVRIRSIEYPNNVSVFFDYDPSIGRVDLPGSLRLNKIRVTETNTLDGATPITRALVFNHSYFYSPSCITTINPSAFLSGALSSSISISGAVATGGSYTRYRLKLNSIDQVGTDGTTKRYFAFGYNPIPLPERFFGARDLYGFATLEIPQSYSVFSMYTPLHSFSDGVHVNVGTSNAISPTVCAAYLLESIANEKGAVITLKHRPAAVTLSNVGGAIIDKTIRFDGYTHENDDITQYTYIDQQHFAPEDNFIYNITTHRYSDPISTTWPGVSQTYDVYSTHANTLDASMNGTNYGFKKVIERHTNSIGTQLSKIIYSFNGIEMRDPDGTLLGTNYYTPDFSNSSPDFNRAFGVTPYTRKQLLKSWAIGIPVTIEKRDNFDHIIEMSKFYYDETTHYISTDNFSGIHILGKDCAMVNSIENFDKFIEYYRDYYFPFTGHTLLVKQEDRKYYSDANFISNTTLFQYDSRFRPTQKSYVNSKGETIAEKYKYNDSWSGASGGVGIQQLNSSDVSRMVYSEKWKQNSLGNFLISVNAQGYDIVSSLSSNIVRPKYRYSLATSALAPLTAFVPNPVAMSNGTTVSNLHLVSANTTYDVDGNPVEVSDNAGVGGNAYNSNIIDYLESGQVLAEAANARFKEVAYSGFESQVGITTLGYFGNCPYSDWGVSASHQLLGRYCYYLSTDDFWDPLADWFDTDLNLIPGQKYTLSYWAYAGSNIRVNDWVADIPNSVNTTPPTATITRDGWTLYKLTFIAQSNNISLKGTGYIDEFKLHPADAIMQTHNYLPLVGKTADVDANDNITTYEYDGFGNMMVIRDKDKNILSKKETHTQY